MPRPPKTQNPLVKIGVLAVVLVVVGGAAYVFVPRLVSQVKDLGAAAMPATSTAPAAGGGGPLGEVNEAMDVSATLDGGSSPTPHRVAPRQPAAVQPPAVPQPPATPATNTAAKATRRRVH